MKKLFLGTSALVGASALVGGATPAWAGEGIKLLVGGYFKEAYMVVLDDDGEDEFGNERNTDGFFNDAEIHFKGSAVMDNGLEYGVRIELEGETDGDQIDEAWVWFSGGFGEFRIGSEDEALANACIVPPGGTGNFSAFSPNQWGSNGSQLIGELSGVFSTNSVCTGVDLRGDAQKIVYISPVVFGGFQLTASYTPSGVHETHEDGVGPHAGMPQHFITTERHDFSVYGTYQYMGDGWGLTAGLGGSWEGHVEEGNSGGKIKEQDFYQAGLNLTFGNFGVGVVGEYYNDARDIRAPGFKFTNDIWVVGAGASYNMDAWTFGLQYSHREDNIDFDLIGFDDFEATQDRIVGTLQYALGPGILLDAELGYTWMDTDPELDSTIIGLDDDYQAFEIGIGTNITF